ncbi:hypothetical protein [uncultured Ruminococcus sp.]|nr:hypothetical protein [uncultured Ruminococcus sp.]
MVVPLTHCENSGFTELKVIGTYLSAAADRGEIWALGHTFVYRIFRPR